MLVDFLYQFVELILVYNASLIQQANTNWASFRCGVCCKQANLLTVLARKDSRSCTFRSFLFATPWSWVRKVSPKVRNYKHQVNNFHSYNTASIICIDLTSKRSTHELCTFDNQLKSTTMLLCSTCNRSGDGIENPIYSWINIVCWSRRWTSLTGPSEPVCLSDASQVQQVLKQHGLGTNCKKVKNLQWSMSTRINDCW